MAGQGGIRVILRADNGEEDVAEDFEFPPINTIGAVANEGAGALLCGDEVASVEGDKGNTGKGRVFPGEAVGEMGLLGAHEDEKLSEAFLDFGLYKGAGLGEAVDSSAVEAGEDSSEAIVIVEHAQAAGNINELFEHEGAMLGLVSD